MNFRKILIILIASTGIFSASAASLNDLLVKYLENDLDMQKLQLECSKAALDLEQSNLNNLIQLNLSTGQMTLKPSASGTVFVLEPSVSVSVPGLNNLGVSASGKVQFGEDSSINKGESVSGTSNAKIKLQAELLGGTREKSKVTRLNAERKFLNAKRAVQKRALTGEKEFYSELKNLYSLALNVTSCEQELYEKDLDFSLVKAKGYVPSSSSYRTSELKYRTAVRNLNDAKRDFVHQQNVFALKCGINYDLEKSSDGKADREIMFETAWNFLPQEIPEVQVVNLRDLAKENFSEIEAARWNQFINELSRNAEKDFTLTAGGGYTFSNSTSASDTIDASLGLKWQGITGTAGVSFPAASDKDPFYTMSVGVNPFGFKSSSIDKQKIQLAKKQEEIAIKQAEENFQTAIVNIYSNLGDLRWKKMSNKEELEVYQQLLKDTENWFKQGIVKESEYKNSKVNYQRAKISCLENAVDFIIFNDEVKMMFVENSISGKNGE